MLALFTICVTILVVAISPASAHSPTHPHPANCWPEFVGQDGDDLEFSITCRGFPSTHGVYEPRLTLVIRGTRFTARGWCDVSAVSPKCAGLTVSASRLMGAGVFPATYSGVEWHIDANVLVDGPPLEPLHGDWAWRRASSRLSFSFRAPTDISEAVPPVPTNQPTLCAYGVWPGGLNAEEQAATDRADWPQDLIGMRGEHLTLDYGVCDARIGHEFLLAAQFVDAAGARHNGRGDPRYSARTVSVTSEQSAHFLDSGEWLGQLTFHLPGDRPGLGIDPLFPNVGTPGYGELILELWNAPPEQGGWRIDSVSTPFLLLAESIELNLCSSLAADENTLFPNADGGLSGQLSLAICGTEFTDLYREALSGSPTRVGITATFTDATGSRKWFKTLDVGTATTRSMAFRFRNSQDIAFDLPADVALGLGTLAAHLWTQSPASGQWEYRDTAQAPLRIRQTTVDVTVLYLTDDHVNFNGDESLLKQAFWFAVDFTPAGDAIEFVKCLNDGCTEVEWMLLVAGAASGTIGDLAKVGAKLGRKVSKLVPISSLDEVGKLTKIQRLGASVDQILSVSPNLRKEIDDLLNRAVNGTTPQIRRNAIMELHSLSDLHRRGYRIKEIRAYKPYRSGKHGSQEIDKIVEKDGVEYFVEDRDWHNLSRSARDKKVLNLIDAGAGERRPILFVVHKSEAKQYDHLSDAEKHRRILDRCDDVNRMTSAPNTTPLVHIDCIALVD